MHFMYIHTHSAERCTIDRPDENQKLLAQMREDAQKAGIKMAGYVAAHEHTMYVIIEANDLVALEKMLIPMTKWGDASLIPVVPIGQAGAAQPAR